MSIVATYYLRNLPHRPTPVSKVNGLGGPQFQQLPVLVKPPGHYRFLRLYRHPMNEIAFVWSGADMIEIITDDVEIGSWQ